MQTLDEAIRLAHSGKSRTMALASTRMAIVDVGKFPDEERALLNICDWLPAPWDRAYTITDFVAAVYDGSGVRYERRTLEAALEAAGELQ